MTGATGAIYGVRLLQVLQEREGWESHLVISKAGLLNLKHEMDMGRQALYYMADVTHDINDIAASIASGAFETESMVIAPCSMKTLAAVAHGFGDNLISRAADVTLKERRRLSFPFRLFRVFENIADSAKGVKQLGVEVPIDFAPQPAYEHIDNIGLRIKVIIPHMLHDNAFGQCVSLVPEQVFQE